jgi:hypothetical protein
MESTYNLIDVSEESTSVEKFAIAGTDKLIIKWKGSNDHYLYTIKHESGVGYWIRLVVSIGYGKASNIIKKECMWALKVAV